MGTPLSAPAPCPLIQKSQRKEQKRLSLLNEPKTSRFRHSVANMRFTSPVSKDMFSRGGKVKGSESPLSRKADNVELIRSISQAGWQSKPLKPPQLPMMSVMEAIVLEPSPSTETVRKIPPLSVEAVKGLGIQMGNSVEVQANGVREKEGGLAAHEKEGTVIVTQTVRVQSESTDTTPAMEIPDRNASRKLRPRISVTIPENRALSFRRVRRGSSQHYEKEDDTSGSVSPGSNPASQSMEHSPNFKLEVVSPVSVEMPKPHRPSLPNSLGVPGTRLVTDPDEKEPSSASSMGRIDDDASSCYSPRSSMSSFHADQLPERKPSPARTELVEFMIISPTDAGVFDDVSPFPKTPKSKAQALRRSKLTLSILKNKPLPPEPVIEVAPLLVSGKPCSRTASINASHIRSHSDPCMSISPVSPIPFSTHLSMSPMDLDTLDEAFRRSSPLFFEPRKVEAHEPSLTLDEAADALEVQLSALAETPSVSWDVSPQDPLQISRGLMDMVPTRPPPLPPVSSASAATDPEKPRPRPKRKAINHAVSQIKPDDVTTTKASSAPTMTIGKRLSLSIAARKAKAALEAVPESIPESASTDRKGSSISSSASSSTQSEESIFTKSSTQDTANSERSSPVALQEAPAKEIEPKLRRSPSRAPRPRSTDLLAASDMPIIPTPHSSPELQSAVDPEELNSAISADAAEKVILNIMVHLDTLGDLFTCAHLNRGFYRTFKRNELSLIKKTLFKMSPAAWELREICPPYENGADDCDAPLPEYTPSIYLRHFSRDMYAMVALKSLILHHCSSFLRAETVSALSGTDEIRSTHIDDAFWRVWAFCRIFGCGKNREEDIVGQIDWLKGGVLAYQQSTASSMTFTDDFGLNSVLFNPPTGFAKGNGKGLSTDELYDMTEIWNCLGVLLRGFHGMRSEARESGIFDNTGVKKGDINAEDTMLGKHLSPKPYHVILLTHKQKNGPTTSLLFRPASFTPSVPPSPSRRPLQPHPLSHSPNPSV
jgi:hypothetical protein